MSAFPPSAASVNAVLTRSLTGAGNVSTAFRAARNHPMRRVSLFAGYVVISDNTGQLEPLLVHGPEARFLPAHEAALDEFAETLVECPHAVRLTRLDGRVHLRELAFANQIAYRGRADHDLVRRDAAAARLPEQRLRYHGAQRLGKHAAHHFLLGRGEHVDDAVDRLGRGTRMHRREHEVTGFRGREREPDRLEIAHLSNEHNVRILAQRRPQRRAEAERVAVDLALVDEAVPALMQKFDRILDRDDVIRPGAVDVVDHRGECR